MDKKKDVLPDPEEGQKKLEVSDHMTCELAVMVTEQLRSVQFISTKELTRLSACHNAKELRGYFETEKKILDAILKKHPDFKNTPSFQLYIPLNPENEAIFLLIQDYTSIDYLRNFSTNWNEDFMAGLKIFVEKSENGNLYISNIQVINK